MGIGNRPDRPIDRDPDLRLITPHGDRKRVAPHSSGGADPTAHYPSWGSETTRKYAMPNNGSHSLPLMGIGNLIDESLNRSALQLITPHGDRKHLARHTLSQLRACSLPLMGIGNDVTGASKATATDSLPLMGIGNPISHPPRSLATRSLPLMGIGNYCAMWKRATCPAHSLPLMGIGNSRDLAATACHPRPHYPSWGSETPLCAPSTFSSPCSLPLMGIGNIRQSASATSICRTHYPSWGSETIEDGIPRCRGG